MWQTIVGALIFGTGIVLGVIIGATIMLYKNEE